MAKKFIDGDNLVYALNDFESKIIDNVSAKVADITHIEQVNDKEVVDLFKLDK